MRQVRQRPRIKDFSKCEPGCIRAAMLAPVRLWSSRSSEVPANILLWAFDSLFWLQIAAIIVVKTREILRGQGE